MMNVRGGGGGEVAPYNSSSKGVKTIASCVSDHKTSCHGYMHMYMFYHAHGRDVFFLAILPSLSSEDEPQQLRGSFLQAAP